GSTTARASINGPYYSTWTVDLLPFIEQQATHQLWDPTLPFVHADQQQLRETFIAGYLCPSDQGISELSKPESGPGSRLDWAPGSYRAMSGHSLGQNGDHYWDNPRASSLEHVDEMPLKWRGAMHSRAREAKRNRIHDFVKLSQITDGTSQTVLVGEYQTATYVNRRTYWAYAYTSYNQSSAFPESRTLIADYVRCQRLGGGGEHTCKRAWGSLHAGGSIQFVFCDGSVHSVDPAIDTDVFVALATIQNDDIQAGSFSF
ncbi:MAG: DUF1559 domain-containing protein, partial [Bythopirellula sp.]